MSFDGDLYPTTGATSVLTTKGDMVDYNTERQRFGIGSTGQVLTVASSLPTWATLTTADSVLTTQGDVLYESASGLARLGFGTSGDVLTTKGTGANPVWETPAGGVIEELGRHTLVGNATSMEVASFTPKRYLQIITHAVQNPSASALDDLSYTFNGDNSSGNYSRRDIFNDSESTAVDQNNLRIEGGSGNAVPRFASLWVVDVAAEQKLCFGTSMRGTSTGASDPPMNSTGAGLWDNEVDQITTVTYTSTQTDSMAATSELIVLGWD